LIKWKKENLKRGFKYYDSTEKTAISKKGKIPQKSKKSKDLNFSKQKQMLSSEIFKKLRENDSFPQIRGQFLPFYRLMPHDSTATVACFCFSPWFDTLETNVSSYNRWR